MHIEMICREQGNNEAFCGLLLWYSEITLTFQLRCKKMIDRLTYGQVDLSQGSYRPRM